MFITFSGLIRKSHWWAKKDSGPNIPWQHAPNVKEPGWCHVFVCRIGFFPAPIVRNSGLRITCELLIQMCDVCVCWVFPGRPLYSCVTHLYLTCGRNWAIPAHLLPANTNNDNSNPSALRLLEPQPPPSDDGHLGRRLLQPCGGFKHKEDPRPCAPPKREESAGWGKIWLKHHPHKNSSS